MLPLFRLSSTQSLKTYARLKYLFLAIAILFFCRSIVGEIFHQKVTSCNSQLEQTLPTEDQCIKSNLLFTGIIDSLKSHLPTEHVLPDFTINEYSSIIHKNSDRGLFFKIIKKNYNSSRLWYYIFFILDFILSIGIVTFFILINAQSYADSDDLKKHKFSQRSLNLIAILGISAFVLDTFEGLHYLYFTEGLLSFITCGKLISYTLFGTSGVLLFVYFKFKTGYFKILGIFVISSFFSLLLIFSLFILVTMVGQGGTIIIDLFSSQLNFLLLFFLINFAAFVLSHFPQYLSEKIDPKKGRTVIWKRYTKSNIFGIIYFNSQASKTFSIRK